LLLLSLVLPRLVTGEAMERREFFGFAEETFHFALMWRDP